MSQITCKRTTNVVIRLILSAYLCILIFQNVVVIVLIYTPTTVCLSQWSRNLFISPCLYVHQIFYIYILKSIIIKQIRLRFLIASLFSPNIYPFVHQTTPLSVVIYSVSFRPPLLIELYPMSTSYYVYKNTNLSITKLDSLKVNFYNCTNIYLLKRQI